MIRYIDHDGERCVDGEAQDDDRARHKARRGDIVLIRRPKRWWTSGTSHTLAIVLAVPGATACGVLYATVARARPGTFPCGYVELADGYGAEPRLEWAEAAEAIRAIIRPGLPELADMVVAAAVGREYPPVTDDDLSGLL